MPPTHHRKKITSIATRAFPAQPFPFIYFILFNLFNFLCFSFFPVFSLCTKILSMIESSDGIPVRLGANINIPVTLNFQFPLMAAPHVPIVTHSLPNPAFLPTLSLRRTSNLEPQPDYPFKESCLNSSLSFLKETHPARCSSSTTLGFLCPCSYLIIISQLPSVLHANISLTHNIFVE